jgi:hypothetical protein
MNLNNTSHNKSEMGKTGAAVGAGIAIAAIIVVALFTNVFELAKPGVDKTIETTKDAVSQVEGKDVVTGVEIVSEKILNETSKIEIKNPLP